MKKIFCLIISIALCFASVCTTSANTSLQYICGDVDYDGNVTVLDATLIQNHLAQLKKIDTAQIVLADTDLDNDVTITDATIIQQLCSKLIPSIPIEHTLDKTVSKVIDSQTDTTLTLSVVSDLHYDKDDRFNIVTKGTNIDNIKRFQDKVDVDFTVNLGDFIIGNTDKQTSIASLESLIDITQTASNAPVLNIRGNHDDNGWYSYGKFGGTYKEDEIINDKEWHEIALGDTPQNFVFDEENPYGGYGYIDHSDSKIRVFMLNSSDIPYILEDDGTYRYTSYHGHCFSDAQLEFVARSLMFSDKENPSEWAALFLTHVPLDTSNLDNERFGDKSALIRGHDVMLSIITAYKNGTAFSFSGSTYNPSIKDVQEDFMVDVNVDYSSKGCGEVIAFFSGHTHKNNYTDKAGVENSLSYGYTFIGTTGSDSFTNYVINREEKTISAFTFGNVHKEDTVGTIVGTVDKGSIESGEWSVTYDQFLPDGRNLSKGLSEVHELYYTFDNTVTTGIDLETLEVIGTKEAKSPLKVTKAIPVKPLTTYVLPDDFKGDCLSFAKDGSKRYYLKVQNINGKNTITTAQRTVYVAFTINTGAYPDYENFSFTELSANDL